MFENTSKKVFIFTFLFFGLGLSLSFLNLIFNKSYYRGIVYEVKENYFLFNSTGERFYVYEKNNQREVGDILEITGEKESLDFVTLESSFNFNDYLNKKGVYSSLSIKRVVVKFSPPLKIQRAKKIFLSKFDDTPRSILSSILFSSDDGSYLNSKIRSLHLGKFLSANGTYIYLFIQCFAILLSFLFKKKWADVGSLAVCSIYFLFVFPKFGAIRIFILLLFRWFNKYIFKQKLDYLAIIGISGIFFLIMDRYLALQDSFILGYLLPITIFFIREALRNYGKIAKKLLPFVLIYIFLIPFEIKFYNSIAPLSFVFQMLLTPLFLIIGLISFLCFWQIPLHSILRFFCDILTNIVSGLEKTNFAFNVPQFNTFLLLVFYFLFFLLLFYLRFKFKPINKMVVASQLLIMLFYVLPINNFVSQEVTFINVGQGDACLIRNKNKTILIDTGGLSYKDIGRECLIPFFKKKRLYKIDLVITTHNHFDHVGALDSLIEDFKVKNYLNERKDFPITYSGITFNNYNNYAGDFEEENSNSLVIGFNIGNKNYLVTGDATTETENKIMEDYSYVPCDILKVGHHGSDTSSSLKFLKFLNPKEAVISVGKNNSYKLPSDSTLHNFRKLNIPVKRTDYLGSISYKNFIFNA